jgi:hypothetical protein
MQINLNKHPLAVPSTPPPGCHRAPSLMQDVEAQRKHALLTKNCTSTCISPRLQRARPGIESYVVAQANASCRQPKLQQRKVAHSYIPKGMQTIHAQLCSILKQVQLVQGWQNSAVLQAHIDHYTTSATEQ